MRDISVHSSGYLKNVFFFALAAVLAISAPAAANDKPKPAPFPKGQVVSFDYFPKDPYFSTVRDIWKKTGETAEIWKKYQEVPNFSIGIADLNGDGRPEILARHSDELWGQCDAQMHSCLMHIYVVTKTGEVEVGSMMAADPVIVLPNKTNGINDIFVVGEGVKDQIYQWNGKRYELRP